MADKETLDLTKLDGSNYPMWKFGVTFLLRAKELTGFIDGTEAEPDKETKTADWKKWMRNSSQAAVILLGSVERSLHPNLINCSHPKEIWDKLKSLYGDATEDAKQNAWERFYAFKIKDGESIARQIEELESICKKLEDADDKPSETAIVTKLLSSLPSRFSSFRMAWECTPDASKKKDTLVSRILREEKRLIEEDATSLALQVHSLKLKETSADQQREKEAKQRKAAKKKKIEEQKKRTKCSLCKEKGHWYRECPRKNERDKASVYNKVAQSYVCDISALYSSTSDRDANIWIADSGAGKHMTYRKEFFKDLKPLSDSFSVQIADDKILAAVGEGVVVIRERLNGHVIERELRNVLFVPDLKRNLFSIGTVTDKGFSFHAYSDRCEIRNRDDMLSSVGVRHGVLYRMLFEVVIAQCNVVETTNKNMNVMLWHKRLGHINVRALKKTTEEFDIKLDIDNESFFCESCVRGKQTRKPHYAVNDSGNFKPGEKIHTDVCGPINVESYGGSRYFLLFKDQSTSFRKVYFMKHKSEVFEKFKDFQKFVETQTGNKIKILRSDNGTEYNSNEFRLYVKNHGIIQEFSSPYIHEQNGRAEREMRTIVECARSMLLCSGVDIKLWTEAISTACYVLNRVIFQPNEYEPPYQKWFNRKPKIKHLRVFGSQAFVKLPDEKRKKFDAKSKKVIMVGYDGESSNYRLWDQVAQRVIVSSDVVFDESTRCSQIDEDKSTFRFELRFGEDADPGPRDDEEFHQNGVMQDQNEPEMMEVQNDPEVGQVQNQPEEDRLPEGRQLRDRTRVRVPERYGIPVSTFLAETVPANYDEAVSGPDAELWKAAMNEELTALEKNKTWTLTTLPPDKKIVGSKWVFTIKSNHRYKARFVARGFSQREGIDYFETFSPVVRYESVRILLAYAAKENLEIMQFDVKTAFLYGDLQEHIYLQPPEGYLTDCKNNLVCKLHRSLYGLKQSSRNWNDKFVSFLKKFNFSSTESDQCVFVGAINGVVVYLALYVDDGLVISACMNAVNCLLSYLESNFEIVSNEVSDFVGLQITRNRKENLLKICQSKYITQVIERFGMSDAKYSSVPAEPGSNLCKINKSENDCKSERMRYLPYREAVGSLLFAARICRPDIEYAVNYASQFMDTYGEEHWLAVKKIIRYLIGTRDHGIIFGNSGSSFQLKGYTDADYAGCTETRKSRSGFIFILNGGPVSWSSKRQSIVSLSTAEAEYIALTYGTQEAIWLRRILLDLKLNCDVVPMFVDNQSAIKLSKNAEFHKRSKHIDVRYHFVREVIERKEIEIYYVPSKEQLADILTKPLPKLQFCSLKEKINVLDDLK